VFRTWLDRAVVLILIALWCCTVYRAATQSISIDEAFCYDRVVSKPFVEMMTGDYDANNHVLYTILAQVSVQVFGVSPLALRIPSLLGGLIFFTFLFLLCRLVFASAWINLLVICLVGMNPFILDFLVISRGYGLSAAFYLAALYAAARVLIKHDSSRLVMLLGGISLGLSVAANLAFAFPGIALLCVMALLLLLERPRTRLGAWVLLFLLPSILVTASIMIVPLSHSEPANFYVGVDSLRATLTGLLQISLYREHSPLYVLGKQFALGLTPVIAPLLLLLLALAAFARIRPSTDASTKQSMALFSGVLATSIFGLLLAHRLFAILYPYRRTGIYMIILFPLSLGAALQYFEHSRLQWVTRSLASLLSIPILVLFLAQTNFRMYGEWPFDENFKGVVDQVIAQHATNPDARVAIGLNRIYGFQFRFYGSMLGLDWIQRADSEIGDTSYDYYVLRPEDRPLLNDRKLKVIYRDLNSYAILAVPANEL
jgi:hypothetical protein